MPSSSGNPVRLQARTSVVCCTCVGMDGFRISLRFQELDEDAQNAVDALLRARCRTAGAAASVTVKSLQQTAQHPRGLFVNLQALGQQIGGRLVAAFLGGREGRTRGTRDGFMTGDQ